MSAFREKHPFLPRVLAGTLGAVLTVVVCWITASFQREAPVQGAPAEGISVPAVMYHNVLPDGSSWLGKFVISASELEGDLRFLQEAGYTAVTPRELSDFVRGVETLPESPILITFDDGFESMEKVVLPMLEAYQFRVTAAIVGKYTDLYSGDVPRQLSYSHLSWNQVKALQDSGLVEIANHSYDLHELDGERRGMKKKRGESDGDYRKALSDDLLLLQEKCRDHLGGEPLALVYPYGFYSEESENLAKEFGFSVTFTCEEGVSLISDKESLFGIKRYNREHGASREAFFQKMGIG